MALTEAQKRAQKTYRDQKDIVQITVQYKSDADIREGQRVKKYVSDNYLTLNAYVKALIKADLDAKNIPYTE